MTAVAAPGLEKDTPLKLRWIRFGQKVALVLLAASSSVTWNWANASAADVVKMFQETEETFANPGQGWMTMRRLPDGLGRFPYSVAYFRLNWEEIEPTEGQYNWRLIDEAREAWGKREARIAFRIMTTNAHSKGYYCSPKWLFDAGCKFFDYVEGGADITSGGTRINRIEPDYSDPVYLEKHGRFKALFLPGSFQRNRFSVKAVLVAPVAQALLDLQVSPAELPPMIRKSKFLSVPSRPRASLDAV